MTDILNNFYYNIAGNLISIIISECHPLIYLHIFTYENSKDYCHSIIKRQQDQELYALADVIKVSLSSGTFGTSFLLEKELEDPSNYRPISLLSTIEKHARFYISHFGTTLILWDLTKAFDCESHTTLLWKLEAAKRF